MSSNLLKVNISIAIIPMAADFGWSPSVSGIVQSAFFYGYMLSQLPGGVLSSKFGGRRVLPAGLALCSLATAGVPLLATTVPGAREKGYRGGCNRPPVSAHPDWPCYEHK